MASAIKQIHVRSSKREKKTYHLKNIESLFNDKNHNIRIISDIDDSGSNSKVILYEHSKSKENFIIKESFPKKTFSLNGLAHVIIESQIYKHLSVLPLLNITPCIYKGFDVVKIIKPDNSKNLLMLNETGSTEAKIISLESLLFIIIDDHELIKFVNNTEIIIDILKNKIYQYVIPNILFQFLYTMECLNNIKFKHNDLHPGNILIEFNKNNILNNDYVINNYNKFILTKKNKFYNFNIDNIDINNKFETDNTNYPDKQEYLVPDIGINIKIFDFDTSILFNNHQEPSIICDNIYSKQLPFNETQYLYQITPPNKKNNTIPNNIDDIYSNIVFSILNIINVPKEYIIYYKKFYNKLFNNTNDFSKLNLTNSFYDILSNDYLYELTKYVELFSNYNLPYNLLMVNEGIFKTADSVFNFSPDIVKGKYTISNIYNTGNIHYYWTKLNYDIQQYRELYSPISRNLTYTRNSNSSSIRNNTRKTKRKLKSSLENTTDFNILKKITRKLKITDDLIQQFTNDNDDNINAYSYPNFILSDIRVLNIKKSSNPIVSFFFPTSKKNNNNLLSSNSEYSSSNSKYSSSK